MDGAGLSNRPQFRTITDYPARRAYGLVGHFLCAAIPVLGWDSAWRKLAPAIVRRGGF